MDSGKTPGPWSTDGRYIRAPIRGPISDVIATVDGWGQRTCAANAAFIVEACNSFNSLREALAFYAGETVHGLAGDNGYRARAVLAQLRSGLLTSQPAADQSQLREALAEMIYETTHLSPMEPDGGHRCIISGATLEKARAALNGVTQPATPTEISMTEAQIKNMVDRFLSWKLPESFNPDGGINFERTFNEHTPHPSKHEPYGTNLFNFDEATAMVRHMLEGLSSTEVEKISTATGNETP